MDGGDRRAVTSGYTTTLTTGTSSSKWSRCILCAVCFLSRKRKSLLEIPQQAICGYTSTLGPVHHQDAWMGEHPVTHGTSPGEASGTEPEEPNSRVGTLPVAPGGGSRSTTQPHWAPGHGDSWSNQPCDMSSGPLRGLVSLLAEREDSLCKILKPTFRKVPIGGERNIPRKRGEIRMEARVATRPCGKAWLLGRTPAETGSGLGTLQEDGSLVFAVN